MVGSHSPATCLHQHGRNNCVHAGQTTASALVQSRGTEKQSSCYAADLKAALRLPTNTTHDRGGFLFLAGIHEFRACLDPYPRDFLLPTPGVTSFCTHNSNTLRLLQYYCLIGMYSDLFQSLSPSTILTPAGASSSSNIPTCSNSPLVHTPTYWSTGYLAYAHVAQTCAQHHIVLSTFSMSSHQDTVNVPRPRKSVTFGLIVLAFFLPFLALYLDGDSWPTVGLNFAAWFFFPIIGTGGAIIHAIICLFRNDQHPQYSKPARRRLRYNNNYSARPKNMREEENIEAAPAPVQRAAIEEPGPVERAPTERPAQQGSTEEPVPRPLTASSTTSVSSSDVEKKDAHAAVPPSRTASATPARTTNTFSEELHEIASKI